MQEPTWEKLTDDGGVRWLKYSFGPGKATTLAARLDDGAWLVVSPPRDPSAAVLDGLGGDVSALLAPNGYHYMGQAAWRARFPQAKSYAAKDSLERLAKRSPDIPYEPLEALRGKLPSRIEVLRPEGMKVSDLMVRATSGASTVWYTGDLISNLQKGDISWAVGLLFSLLGGGSGYRYNGVPAMVYMKDRAAWARSVHAAMEKAPPTAILPGHGAPFRDDPAARTKDILAVL
jgi:glyoxylase-like metal-dependent hydrolase (beta-lactamase superfamily II)